MTKQILSAIKVSALAIALSFGLSYVYAWTAPSTTPPGGNVSAPINTSVTAQTRVGGLTVGGLTLPAGSTITGGGANSTYGSLTVNGSKNGWYGLNFSGAGTLMMHSSYSGFYKAADNGWRWYVTDAGVSNQSGNANAANFCINGGTCLSAAGDYDSKIIDGADGGTYSTYCRITKNNGLVECKIANNWEMTGFGASITPFSATTLGSYSLSCQQGIVGVAWPACCRTNNVTGATECRRANTWTLDTPWIIVGSPF